MHLQINLDSWWNWYAILLLDQHEVLAVYLNLLQWSLISLWNKDNLIVIATALHYYRVLIKLLLGGKAFCTSCFKCSYSCWISINIIHWSALFHSLLLAFKEFSKNHLSISMAQQLQHPWYYQLGVLPVIFALSLNDVSAPAPVIAILPFTSMYDYKLYTLHMDHFLFQPIL